MIKKKLHKVQQKKNHPESRFRRKEKQNLYRRNAELDRYRTDQGGYKEMSSILADQLRPRI